MIIKMIYNGHKAKYFDTMEDANKYISKILNKYKDLDPQEIYRRVDKEFSTTIVIYRCSKLYTMIFLIECFGGVK